MHTTLRKLLTHLSRSLIFLIVLLGLIVATLEYMSLSFTLDGARRVLVESLESQTGRDVRIDGEVRVTLSFFPELLLERINISNIDDFDDEDFITVSTLRVEAALIPLLTGHLHLSDIAADHAKINLTQKKDGRNNWSFETPSQTTKTTDTDIKKGGMERLSLDVFQLTDVAIIYRDESRDQVIEKHLDQLVIDLKDKANPIAEINGKTQGQPYAIKLDSSPLQVLLQGESWQLHGTGHIANWKTKLEANAQLKEKEINASIDIDVGNVNLGLLLEMLEIIPGQDAATDNINIKAKLHGSDLAQLYEQAKVSLQLGKGYWILDSSNKNQVKTLSFTKISSFTSWNKPVELEVSGAIAEEAIDLSFKTNRLSEFFNEPEKLNVDLTSSIADTDVILKGALDLPVKTKQFQLDISLKGKDLERLKPIIDAELPPFNDFSLTGRLIANEKGFILRAAEAAIGDSHMQASIVIETDRIKPLWTVNLKSTQIQLRDLIIDDLGYEPSNQESAVTVKDMTHNQLVDTVVSKLDDVVRAPDMHLTLKAEINKILTRGQSLGNTRFSLQLRDNFIALKRAHFESPGGIISTSASVTITDNNLSGHLDLTTDKFDYGIVARIIKQDAELDGVISTRIDLEFGGNRSDITHWFDNATGQIDIAAWPKNTQPARVLNLWSTNLYLILLPDLKKDEARVNCIVGLLTLDNGIMKEDFLAIDTTKLWINGNANVDFKNEYVKLSLFPRSKTARFFALQTPIRAEGSFSRIRLGTNPLDLTGTYVSFITSPLHVPARRVFGNKIPNDGSAVCEQFFDREYVTKLNEEIRRKEQEDIDEILDSDY